VLVETSKATWLTSAVQRTLTDQLQEFVSDASHELRSPVSSIRFELEVALAHPTSKERTSRLSPSTTTVLASRSLTANGYSSGSLGSSSHAAAQAAASAWGWLSSTASSGTTTDP
jgi:signal transduction histidine kinase